MKKEVTKPQTKKVKQNQYFGKCRKSRQGQVYKYGPLYSDSHICINVPIM